MLQSVQPVLGVDVGNDRGTVVTVLPDGRLRVLVENLPTTAYVTPPGGDPILVYDPRPGGQARRILHDPAHAVSAVKTRLEQQSLSLPGMERTVSPLAVYAAITRDLVRLAQETLRQEGMEPVFRLVLAYPSLRGGREEDLRIRNAMRQAVEQVTVEGNALEVADCLPEAAAAALEYLAFRQQENTLPPSGELTALLVDFGHGTCDGAVVTARTKGDPYQVWYHDACNVGGRLIDARLMEEITRRLQEEGYDMQTRSAEERERLRREVVELKHALSEQESEELVHQNEEDGSYFTLTVSRDRLEELTADLLQEVVEMTLRVAEKATALGHRPEEIVITGGVSQMPALRRVLEQAFPEFAHRIGAPFRPSTAVASGAARLGSRQCKATLYSRFDYGVLLEGAYQLGGVVRRLIPAGTPLPAESPVVQDFTAGGQVACRIFRPKAGTGAENLTLQDCHCAAILNFVVPAGGSYDLTVRVESDENITARLQQSGGPASTVTTGRSKEGGAL